MDKPVITQEQEEKIRGWEYHTGYPGRLLELRAQYLLTSSKCLQSLSLDKLARALYVGYEVEVEEYFKVGDIVILETGIGSIYTVEDIKANLCNLSGTMQDYTGVEISTIRHATESEIVEEEKRHKDKELDEILLDLSDEERDILYNKLVRGDY